MMPKPSHRRLATRDVAPVVDRSMLLFQYMTAAIATVAAVILGALR